MKTEKISDYLKKQDILFGKNKNPKEQVKWGDYHFEKGQFSDAIKFYKEAKYNEGLEKVLKVAVNEGDVFLAKEIFKINKSMNVPWKELAANAEKSGKYQNAIKAYELAGDVESANKIKNIL